MGNITRPVATAATTITAVDINKDRTDLVVNAGDYATTTGSANAYVLALDSAFVLAAGTVVKFQANFTNTGAATLNVNSSGAKNIVDTRNGILSADDILTGRQYVMVYDGTSWQLFSPKSTISGLLATNPAVINGPSGVNATVNILSFTLKGGTLGTAGAVQIQFPIYLGNTSSYTKIIRTTFDGTNYDTSFLAPSSHPCYAHVIITLFAAGATNSQFLSVSVIGAFYTYSSGDIVDTTATVATSTFSKDSTVDKILTITLVNDSGGGSGNTVYGIVAVKL